ncbi:hypothetical protein D3C77_627040 [compost metagenome]
MGQGALVFVARLRTRQQLDPPATGLDQGLQTLARGHRIGLAGPPLAPDLGSIDADQAHIAPILQTQGIAVDHLAYRNALRPALEVGRQRTQRLRRQLPDRGHKKGAHQGRLLQQHCQAHGASFAPSYFLAPNMPKRSANFCTRPPVSSTFCLPV